MSDIDPFAVDPAKVERGNTGHATTQNALAHWIHSHSLVPVSPARRDPQFDVAWQDEGRIYVAEVKSLTSENEERQLRLGPPIDACRRPGDVAERLLPIKLDVMAQRRTDAEVAAAYQAARPEALRRAARSDRRRARSPAPAVEVEDAPRVADHAHALAPSASTGAAGRVAPQPKGRPKAAGGTAAPRCPSRTDAKASDAVERRPVACGARVSSSRSAKATATGRLRTAATTRARP